MKKKEPFYASSCEDLKSANGLICSIDNSQLFDNKCYRVKQTKTNIDGEYEHVNIDDCAYYPNCNDIGKNCGVKNIYNLDNGYVVRI